MVDEEFHQQAVAIDLGEHRGGGNREAGAVALDDGLLLAIPSDGAVAVDQQEVRTDRQLVDGAAHVQLQHVFKLYAEAEMDEYRTSGHPAWDIKYHLTWITKYHHPILRREVIKRARDVTRQVCQVREVTIVRGAASPAHIHLLVSVPPLLFPAKLVPGESAV